MYSREVPGIRLARFLTSCRYNVAFNSSESWEGYMAQYGAVLEELQVSGESLVYESQLDKQWTACRKSHRWLTLMGMTIQSC